MSGESERKSDRQDAGLPTVGSSIVSESTSSHERRLYLSNSEKACVVAGGMLLIVERIGREGEDGDCESR